MEDSGGTASLRSAAPQWSLAGDMQLLDVLQDIHQNIMTKCQETNTKLEQMVADLDNASISLQNVNNKFMSLSNSQFVESRVYDEDEVVTNETVKSEEAPKPVDLQSELLRLSASLKLFEDMHEMVHIVDSDSDTDSEEDGDSVILKPKDVYAHRPLPYIIGSYAWKNKWHAGLEPDDSDTDSSISKPEREVEEYSDSEPELPENIQTDRLHAPVRTESSASSEVISEQDMSFSSKPTPSYVAAELARRLGGPVDKTPETEPACAPAPSTLRKVYNPLQPATSTIFSDEPPPIDESYQNYQSESEYSDDNDIFAELHKNKPYANTNRDQSVSDDLFGDIDGRNNNVTDDLFGRNDVDGRKVEAGDIFSDFAQQNEVSNTRDKQKSSLFEDESEPELFVEKSNKQTSKQDNVPTDGNTVKKPVGGISLFGSNKGAESIGAAILKRNQRKSSSGDESENDATTTPKILTQAVIEPKRTKEKDIFDDLFAKSKKLQNDSTESSKIQNNIQKEKKAFAEPKKTKEKEIFDDLFAKSKKIQKDSTESSKIKDDVHKEKKVDLFSDNLFDDIDDLFTSGVVKMPNKDDKRDKKSIFDDDDDLFADVAVSKTSKASNQANSTKGLLDSDDDLFNEEVKINRELFNVNERETKDINNDINVSKTSKVEAKTSVFDESDDELFSNNKSKILVNDLTNEDASKSTYTEEDKSIFENKAIFSEQLDKTENIAQKKAKPEIQVKSVVKETNVANNVDSESNLENVSNIDDRDVYLTPNTATFIDSPSLFDDEDDQLFETMSKQVEPKEQIKTTKVISDHERTTEINIENENNLIKGSEVKENVSNRNIIETNKEKLPDAPKNVKSLVENKSLDSVFDQNDVHNDIFMDSDVRKDIQKENVFKDTQNNVNFISESTSANSIEIETNKTENDNNQNTNEQKDTLIAEEESSNQNDSFNDIFSDLPPVFEKPKEPKKSKNVNALFDDDSDDEALFFKKNDATLDEIPELSSNNQNLFGLFHDEPPAIDVAFDISDDELFSSQPKTTGEEPLNKIISEPPPLLRAGVSNIIENSNSNTFEKNIDYKHKNTDIDVSDDELFDSHPKRIRPTNKIINASPQLSQQEISKTLNEVSITKVADIIQKPKNIDFDDPDDELVGSHPKTTEKQSSEEAINKPLLQKSDISKTIEKPAAKENIVDETESKFTDFDDSDDELFGSKPKTTEKESSNQKINETLPPINPEILKTVDTVSLNKNDDIKSVGKLKPMNFNINVNTLLPGASPKKTKKVDQTDGQTVSTQSNEELNSDVTIKDEPIMVKSVSFEGEKKSTVLDNTLSKERAKIQIKRRPSTRRARREAVRKSVIDLGDDSTDNSSSFDDKTASESIDKTDHKEQKGQDRTIDTIVPDRKVESDTTKILNIEKNIDNEKPRGIEKMSKVSYTDKEHTTDNVSKLHNTQGDVNSETKIEPISDIYKQNVGISREDRKVISKTVYILNDEDIFSTNTTENKAKLDEKSQNKPMKIEVNITKNTQKQILNIVDNDDEVFRNTASKSTKIVAGIKTLGQVYTRKDTENDKESHDGIFKSKNTKKYEDKSILGKGKANKSLFNDLSDDESELFNKNLKPKSQTLFNSDSDEDLFTGKSKRDSNKVDTNEKEMKEARSLFGDDDNDDIFENRRKLTEPKPLKSTQKTDAVMKTTVPVFEDPLSMFGNKD